MKAFEKAAYLGTGTVAGLTAYHFGQQTLMFFADAQRFEPQSPLASHWVEGAWHGSATLCCLAVVAMCAKGFFQSAPSKQKTLA